MNPHSADIDDAARRVEGWLLDSPVQLAHGPHRGGVAGWVGADGRPEFVYLEITGYFLTAMAWLAAGAAASEARAAQALERGRAALDWMRAVMADGRVPDTRIHMSPGRDDWRNRAVFTFDLAMAARGAACFGAGAPSDSAVALAGSLAGRIEAITGGAELLVSHEPRDAAAGEVPERWSTRPGPHHVKAAAALLELPTGALDEALADVCRATVAHWRAAMEAGWPCRELHPLLYGLEGLLMLPGAEGGADAAERIYARLMDLQAADGTLPAAVDGPPRVRTDVLAQTLRSGTLLRARGRLREERWSGRLDALAAALLRHVRPDGGVLFAPDQGLANSWCAMFAHQALALHARPGDRDLAARAAALLV